jgi:hypothetical protein
MIQIPSVYKRFALDSKTQTVRNQKDRKTILDANCNPQRAKVTILISEKHRI